MSDVDDDVDEVVSAADKQKCKFVLMILLFSTLFSIHSIELNCFVIVQFFKKK